MNSETRQCNKCKNDFVLEQDDFSFYERMKVPVPNVCPDCRFKIRAMWRNEMSLYSRKCDFCDCSIISMYNPKSLYKVYCLECFNSDKWDRLDYKMEYNRNELFFNQLKVLLIEVPKASIYSDDPGMNSEYINFAGHNKNCYFLFNCGFNDDCLYSRGLNKSKESIDSYFGNKLESSYECINGNNSCKVFFGANSSNDLDSTFLFNTFGCNQCFGCVNLRYRSHYFFNEPISPEEYKEKLKEIIGSYSKIEEFKNKFNEFSVRFPHRQNQNLKVINSIGDYLYDSKNLNNCFECFSSENCKNCHFVKSLKDSYDCLGFGYYSELLLECIAVGFSQKIIGSYGIDNCQEIEYSFDLKNCSNCFGCVGLRNASYCILNKQYSKEQYEELKEHITKELTEKGLYGLMMPPEIAPFAYNETIANDNLPLTKEEALAQGFRFEDDIQITKGRETLLPENIPDHIRNVEDSITKEILRCLECERNYKITERELLFYKKMVLPIPRKCFFCRHKDRIQRRGSFKFFIRKCSNCSKDTYTNLTEEVAPIMYCEKCYQKEVI